MLDQEKPFAGNHYKKFRNKNFSIWKRSCCIKRFYGKYEAQKIFDKHRIKNFRVFKTQEPYLCKLCNKIFLKINSKCIYCYSDQFESINGYDIKKLLRLKKYNYLLSYIDQKVIKFFTNKIL